MKEKIKNFNFTDATVEETNNLLNELLSFNDEELSVYITDICVKITDYITDNNIDVDQLINCSDVKLSEFQKIIFDNDRISNILDKFLKNIRDIKVKNHHI